MIILLLICSLFTANKIPQSRFLKQTTNASSFGEFRAHNPFNGIEELHNYSIELKNYNNTDEKYRSKYYKLIEVCVPNLRRGLKFK